MMKSPENFTTIQSSRYNNGSLQTFCFDLPKDADNNLEDEVDNIIKNNELLAEHTIKYEVR